MNKHEEIQNLNLLAKQLEDDYSSWKSHYRELSEYMMPRAGRYLDGNNSTSNRGDKKHGKIINGSTVDALRVIAAGMQGGLTSPSRPWFRYTLGDTDLLEYQPVKEWLYHATNMMFDVFQRSNFYGAIHHVYLELPTFGTSCMLIESDEIEVIRSRPFTVGEYYLYLDENYRPSGLVRKMELTARQMVKTFGFDKCSRTVQDSIKKNSEKRFRVNHFIIPNDDFHIWSEGPKGMEYRSIYYEEHGHNGCYLRESGYRGKPFVSPRWDVTGIDTYGGSPGMDALGDIKMLQKLEEKKLMALDKMVDPPMTGPSSLKGKNKSIVPGGVTYVDVQSGQQGFAPAFMLRPDFQNMAFEIDRVENRIRKFFFNDLFVSILQQDKRMTATEVAKRHEEKLMMLGPVLERLQTELLDPIIDRTFNLLIESNRLPPPPPELEGMDLKIEYVSMLAQAQKMVGISAIEQTAVFVGNLAQMNPNVLDKFDADEAVDQFAEMVGVPPNIIVPDEVVAETRGARAQKEEQQMMMQEGPKSMAEMAKAAKMLSQSDMGDANLLEMAGGAQ